MESADPASAPPAPIRILIAGLSGVLLELVMQLIEQQPDMLLVAVLQGRLELLQRAGDEVDVVLLGAASPFPPPGILSHLLTECPQVRVIVLGERGDMAMAYWLGLRRHGMRAVSQETVLSTIRHLYSLNATV